MTLSISSRLLAALVLFAVVSFGDAQTASPSFEVATIKPAAPSNDGHTHINYPPDDRFSAQNITLSALMHWAYGMPENQILDGPSWMSSTRFDIQAKTSPDEIKARPSDQLTDLKRSMVQALFVERFNLKVHRETRTLPAYDLVLAKGGAKLQPTKSKGESITTRKTYLNGDGITTVQIAEELSHIAGRTVVDKTKLTDRYDLKLQWASDDAPATDDSAPSLFTAIQEQLGLKLEPAKEPVPVLVIDHIELPTPN
jgi:uncharacterized protein (TIGR03435 family)